MVSLVLSAQPIYQLSCMDLPSSKLSDINGCLRSFFWQGSAEIRKFSLAWDQVCRSKVVGGACIKNIKLQGKALGARLILKMIQFHNLKCVKMLTCKNYSSLDLVNLFRETHPPKGLRF